MVSHWGWFIGFLTLHWERPKVVDVVHFVVFAAFKEDMDYLTQLIADHVRTPKSPKSVYVRGICAHTSWFSKLVRF